MGTAFDQRTSPNEHRSAPMDEMLRAALDLARLGPVFPCAPREKRPLTRHGFKDASTDPKTIRAWWSRWPDANIGLVTGNASGLLILDIDPRNGGDETFARLEAEHGSIGNTLRARTGGGGFHVFVQLPDGEIRQGANVLGPGVDVKGDGGYVIAPPSVHPSGERYTWANDTEPAPCPTWVAELAAPRGPTTHAASAAQSTTGVVPAIAPAPTTETTDARVLARARKYLAKLPAAFEGEDGSGAAFEAAQTLVRGFALPPAEALELLRREYNPRCRPPWSERELEHKIADAATKSQRALGYLLEANAARNGERAAAKAAPRAQRADGEGAASKGRRLADLMAKHALVRSPTGRAFALMDGTALPCDSSQFRAWCASSYWRAHGDTISESTIKDVILALSGHGLPEQVIPVRVGGDMSRVTVDLGACAIAVTASGIAPAPDAAFMRPSGMQLLPEPARPPVDAPVTWSACVMEELRNLLGITAPAFLTCVTWLLAALRPAEPYPMLYIRGEQGSGKSTLARALRHLIDPRHPSMSALPRDKRDLAIMAEHAHVLAIDNISQLSADMSDALCRLATRDGFETRANYTDRGLATFDLARPILVTSIVDAATRGDLLDRALIVHLPTRDARRDDDKIHEDLEALRPRVLGALFSAISHAMRADEVAIPADIRMRAPAAFAARAAPALGIPSEAILRAYQDSRALGLGVLAEDPLVSALLRLLGPGETRCGTMGDLLRTLGTFYEGGSQDFPRTPRALSAALQRLAPTLRPLGISHLPPTARTGHESALVHTLTRAV